MAESVAYAVKLDAEAGLIGQGWCDRSSKTQGQDDISRINYLLRWTLLRRKKKPTTSVSMLIGGSTSERSHTFPPSVYSHRTPINKPVWYNTCHCYGSKLSRWYEFPAHPTDLT